MKRITAMLVSAPLNQQELAPLKKRQKAAFGSAQAAQTQAAQTQAARPQTKRWWLSEVEATTSGRTTVAERSRSHNLKQHNGG